MTNGSRIKLRPKRIADAREDYTWQTDPELTELDAADPLHMSYPQYLSEYSFDLSYPSSTRHEFSIDTLSGEHIGNCVYYNVNSIESKAEVGIMIGNRSYWNKGYGVESIKALLDYVFTRTRLERVYLTTLEWNIRAQKCFRKCGFKECGHLVRDDHNFLIMTLHRGEWEQIRSQSGTETASVPATPETPAASFWKAQTPG